MTRPTPTAVRTTPPSRRWTARRLALGGATTLLGLGAVSLLVLYLFTPIGERYREAAVDAAPLADVTEVDLVDSRFTPASIVVPAGTTVTWHWTDDEDHDVWFEDGEGTAVRSTGTWSRTFTESGAYRYTCRLHLFMDGRVVVE